MEYYCVGQSTAELINQSFNVVPLKVAENQSQLIEWIFGTNISRALYLVGNLSEQIDIPNCEYIQCYSNSPINQQQY